MLKQRLIFTSSMNLNNAAGTQGSRAIQLFPKTKQRTTMFCRSIKCLHFPISAIMSHLYSCSTEWDGRAERDEQHLHQLLGLPSLSAHCVAVSIPFPSCGLKQPLKHHISTWSLHLTDSQHRFLFFMFNNWWSCCSCAPLCASFLPDLHWSPVAFKAFKAFSPVEYNATD